MALLTKQHQGQLAAQVPAQRMRVMRWRDLRLWAGLVIILFAMFIGAFLLSRGEETTTVWRASSDLSVGAIPVATPVTVSLGAAQDQYLLASEPLTGQLRWPVAAGDLIPRGALGFSPMVNARMVTLPVDPLHAPVNMAAGAVVDIWSTPADVAGGVTAQPVLVLASVTVAEVAAVMRVSKMTVYRLVHAGELPAVRVGRSFRVPEQAVHDYLRDSFVETA